MALLAQVDASQAFVWLRPGAAWAPAIGLVVLAAGAYALARRRRERERLVHPAQLARFLPGFSAGRAAARVVLASLATLLIGVALVGPVKGYVWREVVGEGLDLVVCIDTSRSMLARDVRPDRLERAKREVKGLFDVLGEDRVALVAFSGDARQVAPLTRDRAALAGLLERVSPEDNRLGGTSVAAALERALELLGGGRGPSGGAGQAIVLVTDGEDLAGQGLAVARTASARGVRVFVVGVGTVAGGKIPVSDGGGESFLADKDGGEVVTRMDKDSLRRVALETGGAFLAVDEDATPLETLYAKRIARLEGRELVGGKERIPQDRYQWPLAAALLFMLGEAGLRERRPSRSIPATPGTGENRGGRTPMGLAAVAALAALLSSSAGGAQAPLDSPVRFQGTPREALAAIRDLSAREPERAIGLAREFGGDASLAEPLRAEFRFAEGVVTAELSPAAAVEPFLSARALAGPGELRDAATYDQGTAQLLHAEALREEAFRQMLDPAALGAPSSVDLQDPFARPRGAYLAAKETLLEGLRSPGDRAATADARANLELIQRRLAELDELERPEEEPEDGEGGDQEEPQEGDDQPGEGEEGEQGDDREQQDQREEGQDPEGQQQEPDAGAPEEEPSIPDVGEIPEDVETSEPAAAEPAERRLSREEVLRLLDRLEELEAEREAIDAQLRAVRRVPVEEDW